MEFKLPEERNQFYMAADGEDYYSVLWEYSQYFFSLAKCRDLTDEEISLRDKLYEFMDDFHVDLNKIS